MANWSLPALSSLYADLLAYLKARDDDAARLNDSRVSAASNMPDYSKRWNDSAKTLQNWLSAQWNNLVIAVAGGGTGANNATDARTNLGVYSTAQVDAAIVNGAVHSTAYATVADVTLINADTWYTGPSVSLAAGTWLVFANINIYMPSNGGGYITTAIKSSTTTYVTGEIYKNSASPFQTQAVPMVGPVTLGATTSIYGAARRTGSALSTTQIYGTGSHIAAVKIG
jgi:hypothetical protein